MQIIEFNIEDSELETLKDAAQFYGVSLYEIYEKMITYYLNDFHQEKSKPEHDPQADRLLQKILASGYEHQLREDVQRQLQRQIETNCESEKNKNIIRFPTVK